MGRDEEERPGTSADLLAYLMTQHASALARIETRLMAVEACVTRRLTPQDLAKLLAAAGLVLLALTGNVELAKRLLGLL